MQDWHWYLIGAVIVAIVFAMWRRRQAQYTASAPLLIDAAVESGPDLNVVLLYSVDPAWNADRVADCCAAAWSAPFNQHERDTRFVIGEPPVLMIRDQDWYFMLCGGGEAYADTDQPGLLTLPVHQAWTAIEFLHGPEEEPRESIRSGAEQRLARLLAALMATEPSPSACLITASGQIVSCDNSLMQRLATGDFGPLRTPPAP